MTDLPRFIDTYATQTRLLPAIFCVLPLIVSAAAWFPDSYKLAAGLTGSMGMLASTALLAHFSRHRGREIERRLFSGWGGPPTSLWLRRIDTNLDEQTKKRYRAFLESRIPEWKPPTAAEEEKATASSMQTYDTAIRWLREHTRDARRFPLIHKENVSYGFRRNALGLKWYGAALAALSIAANVAGLPKGWTASGQLANAGLVAVAISAISLAVWIVIVSERWVRDAADGYARALLAACESLDQ